MKLEKVIAATDFSEASLPAIETAFNLLLGETGKLYLAHVLDLPSGVDPMGSAGPSENEFRRDALEKLAGYIPENADSSLEIESVVLRGTPAKALAEFAQKSEADLIVVGTHGRSGLARLLLGSTTESLLRKAPCRVLVAKHPH